MTKLSQASLIYRVLKHIKDYHLISKGDQIVVALSGGADSVVLFDVLLSLSDQVGFTVTACHFNHKMRGEESNADEKFVSALCQKRGVKCIFGAAKEKIGSEEEAREARYAFFEKILERGEGSKIALAHNANDVAETFLMRVSRGSGFSGLKSIPRQRQKFIRPLLPISKKEIEKYAKEHELEHVVDQSNFDPKYLRNFFRLKIVPLFESRNPNFINTLFRSIVHIENDEDFLTVTASGLYEKMTKFEDNKLFINLKDFSLLHPAMQYRIVRKALEKFGPKEDIGAIHLEEVVEMIQRGKGKKEKQLPHSLLCEVRSGNIIIYKASRS